MTNDAPKADTAVDKIGASPSLDQRQAPKPAGECGDFEMRIAADGTWYYRGSPIGRMALVKLFASILKRDEAGDYWLETPVERGRIQVDDAPFTAIELSVSGSGEEQRLSFRSNLDEWVDAGPDRPLRVDIAAGSEEPRPYILIRDQLEALILRPVFYQLAELAVPRRRAGRETLGVWSNGRFFPLGPSF
ncbi:MAG: DUF1285 domain-containing protein [Kiloniellales bacterium]